MAIKADLHFHPGGFWSPDRTGAKFEPVVSKALERGINLVTLTSCHDDRFTYYLKQAEENKYFSDFDDKRKIFKLEIPTEKGIFHLYFLDGQEIKGKDGDINLICPGKRIIYEPRTKTVEYLTQIGRDSGALTSLPHAFGKDGLASILLGQYGVEIMFKKGLFNFVEVWDGLMSKKGNKRTYDWYRFMMKKRESSPFNYSELPKAISVSDGHYNGDVGKAFTFFELPYNIPVDEVFDNLRTAEVSSLAQENFGSISLTSKARYALSLSYAIMMDKIAKIFKKV